MDMAMETFRVWLNNHDTIIGEYTGGLVCLLAFAYVSYHLPGWIRQWGKAMRTRKAQEEYERNLMSEGLRMMIQTFVSADQLHQSQADEWYRKFSRLQIPDLLPPVDYLKEQIKKRRKMMKKASPIKFPDPVDWTNFKVKEVKKKKNLIAA